MPSSDAPASGSPTLPSPEVWHAASRLSETLHARLGRQPQAEPDEATLARPLHLAVGAVAAQAPDAIAATDGTVSVTYGELWQRAQSWAARIRAAEPPPGPLALLLPADPFYAAGLLGCLIAGYPCLPLDPANPSARIQAILQSAGLGVVVTRGTAKAGIDGMHVIDLDGAPVVEAFPSAPVDPDAPALLVATSGSTGTPKLVVHSHRTITHRSWMRMQSGRVSAQDRYYFGAGSVTSIADIAHVMSAMLSGASVILIDLARVGIRVFLDRVAQLQPTIIRCGISLMRTLLTSPNAAASLRSVRLVRLTGEQLFKADIQRLREILPTGCEIVTGYTSTEMAGHFGWVVLDDDPTDPMRVPAAGIESARDLVILNETRMACATGEVGEILVRSQYNALGEWIDGRCVPGRLVPDPDDPSQRIYASGDLGYRGETGAVVIVGRADRQLKVNGVRIDPSETEAALRRQPGIRDAVVLARQSGEMPSLVAFVVGDDAGLDVLALRARLRQELPSPLLPSRITVLERFPRLPNGKVDGVTLLADVTDR